MSITSISTVLGSELANGIAKMGVPIAEKAVRTMLVYVAILVLLRLAGKRDLAQLNTFDLVVLLLLSNVVQNAIIGPDDSVWGGVLGAALLVGANALIVRIVTSNKTLIRIFEGDDSVLIEEGEVDKRKLRKLGLAATELDAAVRRQGANSTREVKRATLSPGGAITVEFEPKDENATKGDIWRLEDKLDALLADRA